MAMAEGANKPDPVAVQKLADDLGKALSDGRLSVAEQYKLSEDLEAVMNGANIPSAEVEKAVADAQAMLIAYGVDKGDAQTVVYDMQQIAAEAKKNVQEAAKRRKP